MHESEPIGPIAQVQEKAAMGDQGASEADRIWQSIRKREQELQAAGMTEGIARGIASIERRIAQWPKDWKNELRIIIYGDFRPPDTDLHFQDLGIVVETGAVKDSPVRSAMCVLRARITISEKSVAGLVDAAARINTFMGVLAAVDWGNSGSGWWCHLTHENMGGSMHSFERDTVEKVIKVVQTLQPDVRRKVISALHWIREPRQMMMEGYRRDVLQVYAGYWNAFECLVEAVCLLRPQLKLSRMEKQARIDQFLAEHGGRLDASGIRELYQTIVNPGFVAKASHALRQCFPDRADQYIVECFTAKPERDRLYNVRNAINHGDIEAEHLEELIRIEDKHRRLWMIVFGMLGQIIPVPRPLDPEPV